MTYIARRKREYLKPLTKNDIPRNFLFVDTETFVKDTDNGNVDFPFRLGVAIYGEIDNDCRLMRRHVYRFSSPFEFIQVLETHTREKTKLYVIAHNIGFDVRCLNLPNIFNDLGWTSEPPIINERTFMWTVKTKEGKIVFLDTANYGIMSVEKLGEDLKLEKLKIDFNTDDLESLYIYCQRDVEIIETFMLEYIRFIHTNGLGSFKQTLASQSMTAYRTRFLTKPPFIHCDRDVLKLERDAYHGGRTEAFVLGEYENGDYYQLDVNSMYPYVMKTFDMPIRLRGYTENVSPKVLPIRLKKWYVIADVTLETQTPCFAVIRDKKLIFPTGVFRTVLHHTELIYAQKKGYVKAIHRCAVYDKGTLFSDYVTFFYDERRNAKVSGNSSWSLICKLFMNSLYGKFGQLQPQRKVIGENKDSEVWRIPTLDLDTGLSGSELCWYGTIYREWKEGETSISNAAIAGAVTASARMVLWDYIEKAKYLNVYYSDTDCLITNSYGFKSLTQYIEPLEIGMLKLEGNERSLRIFGNKDYTFGKHTRIKGVPNKAKEVERSKWHYVQFQGFNRWLSEGAIGGARGKWSTRSRKTAYNKGKVLPTGRVIPFSLSAPSLIPSQSQ